MTDQLSQSKISAERIKRTKKRNQAEIRFKYIGLGMIIFSVLALLTLINSIFSNAIPAFYAHSIEMHISFDKEAIDPSNSGDVNIMRQGNYGKLIKEGLSQILPEISGRRDVRTLSKLVSVSAEFTLINGVVEDPSLLGKSENKRLLLDDDADNYLKGFLTNRQFYDFSGLVPFENGFEIPQQTREDIIKHYDDFLNDNLNTLLRERNDVQNSLKRVNARIDTLENQTNSSNTAAKITALKDNGKAIQQRFAVLDNEVNQIEDFLSSGKELIEFNNQTPSAFIFIGDDVYQIEKLQDRKIQADLLFDGNSFKDDSATSQLKLFIIDTPEKNRLISDKEIIWLEKLQEREVIQRHINSRFLTGAESREPEYAGLFGAVKGSFLLLIVTLVLSFPVGVAAAIYLEEFAPKNRLTEFLEVNINNLAAVPSIIFGLLGLAIFLNAFGLPRGTPLVGGMVLALMTLPTIVIASRAALRSVPPSIREAALGLGASKLQTVNHHVVPLALPGMLTGAIIGMAGALGETAPLLMIGMFAAVFDVPMGFTDKATALPVQIYTWAGNPELTFQHKTAAAIVCLLAFLVLMNLLAIILRKKFERRW